MNLDADDIKELHSLVQSLAGPELTRLRAELAEGRELNRKLWVAVGKLRLAHGIAWAAMNNTDERHRVMCGVADRAGDILEGIIGLTPEEGDE